MVRKNDLLGNPRNSCELCKYVHQTYKDIHVWYTHANSLPNQLDKSKGRIQESDIYPEIICITGVKPKSSRYSRFTVRGLCHCCEQHPKKTGREIIISCDKKFEAQEFNMNFSFQQSVLLNITNNDNNILLGYIHTSPK